MIPVIDRGHLFSVPLLSFMVVVSHVLVDEQAQLFECFARFVIHIVLHVSEERFDGGIVDAIATSRHRLNQVHPTDFLDVLRVGVVNALVGMDQGSLKRYVRENRIVPHALQGIQHDIHLQMYREVPCHNLASCNILHDGKIGEAVMEGEIRDVRGEYFERNRDIEFSVQLVFKSSMLQGFLHDHFVRVVPSDLGDEMIFVHESRDLFVIHENPIFLEFHLNCPPTVLCFSSKKDFVNLPIIAIIFVRRVSLFQPGVVAASGDVGELAKMFNASSNLSHEAIFLLGPEFDSARLARSLAKKSFSNFRYATSASNLWIRSVSVTPFVLGLPPRPFLPL